MSKKIFFIILFFFLLSCKKKSKEVEEIPKDFNNIDVSGAIGFCSKYIYNAGKTYKIMEDGSMIPIQFYKDGTKAQFVYSGIRILDCSQSHLIMVVDNQKSYLINKSSGQAELINNFNIDADSDSEKTIFQSDASNALYILTEDNKVYKIQDLFASPLNAVIVTPETDQVVNFAVDKSGNLLYSGRDLNGNRIHRLRRTNGNIENITGNHIFYSLVWLGFNDSLYYAPLQNATLRNISRLDINTTPASLKRYYSGNDDYYNFYSNNPKSRRIKNKSRIIVSLEYLNSTDSPYYFSEIYNPTHTSNYFALSEFSLTKVYYYACSDDYLYVAGSNNSGQKKIVKMDVDTHVSNAIYTNTDILISYINIDRNSNVYFVGTIISNNSKVVGRIDNTGITKIIDEDNTPYQSPTISFLKNR
jgi:hypothetical protein